MVNRNPPFQKSAYGPDPNSMSDPQPTHVQFTCSCPSGPHLCLSSNIIKYGFASVHMNRCVLCRIEFSGCNFSKCRNSCAKYKHTVVSLKGYIH